MLLLFNDIVGWTMHQPSEEKKGTTFTIRHIDQDDPISDAFFGISHNKEETDILLTVRLF